MSTFSGKKQFSHETTITRTVDSARRIPIANPRSANGKYLPVRISTTDFDGPPGSINPSSSRKTLGLSSRKPIRNLHKLLESPKRTVRKRLDKLYDYSKPKENGNPSIIKTQALSAKKFAAKIPITPARKPVTKSVKVPHNQKSRESRLLPPGTITGSFLNGRNSLASRTFVHKPTHNRLTLVRKDPQARGPSNVPEESPQPLESSLNSSGKDKRLPTLDYTSNKSTEGLKKTDSNGSTNIHKDPLPLSKPQDEKESSYCSKCSRITNKSDQSKNDIDVADPCPKILLNSKEISEEDVIHDENKTKASFQRPTVIVMQKESAPELTAQDLEESVSIPVQDGSYSEILSLRPSTNSSLVDESLLFKRTESACIRSEISGDSNSQYNTTEFICMLLKQREFLTQSISEYEKNLTLMKLTLKKVNEQLNEQEALKLDTKLETLSKLPSKELSAKFQITHKEGFEFGEKAEENQPEEKEVKSHPESLSVASRAEEERKDSAKDKSPQSKQKNNDVENIENEPPQRRRSARLAKKNAGDLALSVVEQNTTPMGKQEIIKQAKSKNSSTPGMTTPLRSARWGRRSERPLREYMVLKSAMKFLNTPDSRRYRIGSDEKVKIRESLDKTDDALLSDKLLKELHDLYATP